MSENTNTTTKTTTNATAHMICPICGKITDGIDSYAAHIMEHKAEHDKYKAEAEKKERVERRRKAIENLEALYAEKKSAEKKYNDAFEAYRKEFGYYDNATTDPIPNLFKVFFG